MESNRALARAGYMLAFMLFVIPVFDGFTSVWPLHPGDVRWRFGAIGTLSNMTLVPLLGILIALSFAVWLDHRRFRRVAGWLCAIFAVLLAVTAIFFILDFLQTRTQVRPQFRHAMDVASTTSLMKQTLTVVALTLLARAGLAGKIGKKRDAAGKDAATPLIPLADAARDA